MSRSLGYEVHLPEAWKDEPERNSTDRGDEEVFLGGAEVECCSVAILRAHAAAPLGRWLESVISVSGFPIPALVQPGQDAPKLLEWEDGGASLALAERFDADEVVLHHGLALFPRAAGMARLYVVSVRRHDVAWKCSLSLATACLPGMAEEMVVANDHVRAGATIGHLRLTSEHGR